MREEGRISSWQGLMLGISFFIGTSTLLLPVGLAKQDGWLAILLATLVGVGLTFLWQALGDRFRALTPFTYLRLCLGTILGTGVGLLYLIYFAHLAALVLRNIIELYTTAIMPETPSGLFALVLVALAAWLVFSGLEAVARLSELLAPLVLFLTFVLYLLTLLTPNLFHLENTLPFLENGFLPVVKEALLLLSFPFGEGIVFLFILPFFLRPRLKRVGIRPAMVVVGFSLALFYLRIIWAFGANEASRLNFPTLAAIQLINVLNFVQRIDALAVFAWTTTSFIKFSLTYYVFTLGLAEITGLADYRGLILPAGLCLGALALNLYPNSTQMFQFAFRNYAFYAPWFQVIIPLLVLLVAVVRKKKASVSRD